MENEKRPLINPEEPHQGEANLLIWARYEENGEFRRQKDETNFFGKIGKEAQAFYDQINTLSIVSEKAITRFFFVLWIFNVIWAMIYASFLIVYITTHLFVATWEV